MKWKSDWMGVELVMAVLAFGIASGTLMYNVHEFRHISKEFGGGLKSYMNTWIKGTSE